MQLSDEQRKRLTLYLEECWHEWLHIIPEEDDGYYDYTECQKCHEKYSGPHRGSQRTFTTPADLHAVYSAMVTKEEWKSFIEFASEEWARPQGYVDMNVYDFTAWLSCYGCPEQIPEQMKLAADWIRERE